MDIPVCREAHGFGVIVEGDSILCPSINNGIKAITLLREQCKTCPLKRSVPDMSKFQLPMNVPPPGAAMNPVSPELMQPAIVEVVTKAEDKPKVKKQKDSPMVINKKEIEDQAAANKPTQSVGSFMPGMVLSGVEDESQIDVDAVLSAAIPELVGGPSKGGLSWHTLEDFMKCERKAYFAHAQGYRKKGGRSVALGIGSLVHACFEMHYMTGGRRTFEPCDVVARAGGVGMAGDARKYVYACLMKYGQEEALTWDVRGLEVQGTYFLPPVRIGNKSVSIPLTCRHDMVIALRDVNGPYTPPGQPCERGVYILDHKTCAALTYELTKGYGMDGQFLMNALIFRRAEEPRFGKFNGVYVSLIAKHKQMDPDKSLFRCATSTSDAALDEFEKVVSAVAQRFCEKLTLNKDNMEAWSKNYASCVSRYGLCPYFDVCDAVGSEKVILDMVYAVDESAIKDVGKFLKPEKKHEAHSEATAVQNERAPKKIRKAQKKKAETELVVEPGTEELTAGAAAKTEEEAPTIKENGPTAKELAKYAFVHAASQYDAFMPKSFTNEYGSLDKPAVVKKRLADILSNSWQVGTEFDLIIEERKSIHYLTNSKGFICTTPIGKVTLTYLQIADAICSSWWDTKVQAVESAEVDDASSDASSVSYGSAE